MALSYWKNPKLIEKIMLVDHQWKRYVFSEEIAYRKIYK
jgi:hypothetical protein